MTQQPDCEDELAYELQKSSTQHDMYNFMLSRLHQAYSEQERQILQQQTYTDSAAQILKMFTDSAKLAHLAEMQRPDSNDSEKSFLSSQLKASRSTQSGLMARVVQLVRQVRIAQAGEGQAVERVLLDSKWWEGEMVELQLKLRLGNASREMVALIATKVSRDNVYVL